MEGTASDHSAVYQAGRDLHVYTGLAGVRATHTVPRDAPAFTGRDDELARVGQDADIFVVGGMAGVGKTAFAVHAAHLLADRFPDGTFFLRLHGHTPGRVPATPTDAVASLLGVIGVPPHHIPVDLDERTALWRAHLATRKVLLVLDDAIGHDQVEPLLPSSDGSLVLITSRRRLAALPAAVPIYLGTLPDHEAAALFTRLAGRGSGDHDDVLRVVALCGRLPLAVSILAGQLRHHPSWSVADLVSDLTSAHSRLAELQAEDIAVAAAFDLSYHSLPVQQRHLFRYLGLHPGTDVDVEAAAALVDSPVRRTRKFLDDLYGHHLLEEPVRGRFRMHDLIHDYARTLVAAEPEPHRTDAVRRLLHHYVRAGEAANEMVNAPGADRAGAWEWLRREHQNLIMSVDLAVKQGELDTAAQLVTSLDTYLIAVGPWDQAVRLHQLIADRTTDAKRRAKALNRLGTAAYLTGDYGRAVSAHRDSLTAYRGSNDRSGQVAALNGLGTALRMLDDCDGAATAHLEALAIARDAGDVTGEAFGLNHLGVVHLVVGEFTRALDAHRRALSIYETLNDGGGQADALVELGVALRVTGDLAGAAEVYERALRLYATYEDSFGHAFVLNLLGTLKREAGSLEAARELHLRALDLTDSMHDPLGEAFTRNELGELLRLTGNHRQALDEHSKALAVYRSLGHRLGQAESLNKTGLVFRATGDLHRAREAHIAALHLARQAHCPLEQARALERLASCTSGEPAESAEREASAIYHRLGLKTPDRLTRYAGSRPESTVIRYDADGQTLSE